MDGAQHHSCPSLGFALLVLDVDGVLTDGRSWPDNAGRWRRKFSVRDSIALKALKRAGAKIAIVTRSQSEDIDAQAAWLGADDCLQGCRDKAEALRALMEKHRIEAADVVAVIESDDDEWMAGELGCVIATQSGGARARRAADFVTDAEGGDGAVREACNALRAGLVARAYDRARGFGRASGI